MGYTRHRTLTTMRSYVRRAKLSRESPAGKLGLQDDARRQPRTCGPREKVADSHHVDRSAIAPGDMAGHGACGIAGIGS